MNREVTIGEPFCGGTIEPTRNPTVRLFDFAVGVKGNSSNRASDHLPVFADFLFGADNESDLGQPTPNGLRIVSRLPNPFDKDAGAEEITIQNPLSAEVVLDGSVFRDLAGNEFGLSGRIAPNSELTIQMTIFSMPLNNSGDEITLFDKDGNSVDHVRYTKSQVVEGQRIHFAGGN